jgi:hypothetical protein
MAKRTKTMAEKLMVAKKILNKKLRTSAIDATSNTASAGFKAKKKKVAKASAKKQAKKAAKAQKKKAGKGKKGK